MRWRIDFRDHRAHLFLMQQSGKRLTILVTNEEVIAIDDFRFKNRMRNRSDAVRALLKLALKKVGRRPSKATVRFGADLMSVFGGKAGMRTGIR